MTGPILWAAWKEGAKRYIRLWAELRTNVTYQPDKLVVAGGQEIAGIRARSARTRPGSRAALSHDRRGTQAHGCPHPFERCAAG